MNLIARKIGLFLPFLVLLLGCSKEPDYLYRVTSLELFNVDNSGTAPMVVANNGTIAAKAYCIGMGFMSEITGSTAGTDPNESGYALYTKIVQFNISSTTDFDAQHLAGSSLNNYFYYGPYGPLVDAQDSISYALAANLVFAGGRTNYSVNSWQDSAYLLLMQPPTLAFPGPRTFIVNVSLADSTQFIDSISVNLD